MRSVHLINALIKIQHMQRHETLAVFTTQKTAKQGLEQYITKGIPNNIKLYISEVKLNRIEQNIYHEEIKIPTGIYKLDR